MSDETLLTAARRVARFFRIDMTSHGGLVSIETIQAVEVMDIQIEREKARLADAMAAKKSGVR